MDTITYHPIFHKGGFMISGRQTSSVASRRLQSVVLEDWPWGNPSAKPPPRLEPPSFNPIPVADAIDTNPWCDAYYFSESFSKSHMHIYSYIALLVRMVHRYIILATWLHIHDTHTWLRKIYVESFPRCMRSKRSHGLVLPGHRAPRTGATHVDPLTQMPDISLGFPTPRLGGDHHQRVPYTHSLLKINGWNTSIIIPSRWFDWSLHKKMGWWL